MCEFSLPIIGAKKETFFEPKKMNERSTFKNVDLSFAKKIDSHSNNSLKQSLSNEYFKVTSSLQAQPDESRDKHRLSSDSSTNSSYLFNLGNHSQTCLVKSSPVEGDSTARSTLALNETDSTNVFFLSSDRSTITSKFGHIGGAGHVYQKQQEPNCIIVDDDEGNCHFGVGQNVLPKSTMDKVMLGLLKKRFSSSGGRRKKGNCLT